MASSARPPSASVLDSIGADMVGVMAPVSICMLTVVLIVYSLSSSDQTPIRTAANLVYVENPSDSVSQKLEGSLLNAVVFVGLVAAVTFLLLLLYYYNFTSFLIHYTRFSVFFILSTLGGSVFVSLLRRFSIPIDSPSFLLLLLNFSVLGSLSLFSAAFPIVLRQFYTVSLGVITAVWFSRLPEWTTWTLLIALALYDLAAVLAPGGPLKLLVELAAARGEDLPALVYESRAAAPPVSPRCSLELQPRETRASPPAADDVGDEEERSPLVERDSFGISVDPVLETEAAPAQAPAPAHLADTSEERESDGRGVRLGLGDFIFYSVMVGRAAMYDLMTVYACYLAIVSGLGLTLALLTVYRRALPALPISIALGVAFYFLTRLLMEPFVVGAATNLLMF